ncbi:MAG: hypothetical protein LBG80_20865 [Bacteroidales bacterium]|jgi:hypothetical protein|nr:hypothetical protein [Bacteroidales bacterium]
MKRIVLFIFTFVIIQTGIAQNNDADVNKDALSAKFGNYFEAVNVQENGTIICWAKGSFDSLKMENKELIITDIFSKINNSSLLLVIYEEKEELWTFVNAKVILSDQWNFSDIAITKSSVRELERFNKHPWFIGLSLNGMIEEDNSYFLAIFRGGFFLYKNCWDLAMSGTGGISDGDIMFDIGVNSRVYYPIKKIKLSPYIGVGISYNVLSLDEHSWDFPIYAGLNWYLGPGSIDLGIQAWKNFSVTLGYTFSPRLRR